MLTQDSVEDCSTLSTVLYCFMAITVSKSPGRPDFRRIKTWGLTGAPPASSELTEFTIPFGLDVEELATT